MDNYLLNQLIDLFLWLGFFVTVFFAYYYYLKFRSKEKMLLIEKGADISDAYKKRASNFPWFIIGFTVLGCSIGFFLGLVAPNWSFNGLTPFAPMIPFALMFLFGSIGLILGNLIERMKRK